MKKLLIAAALTIIANVSYADIASDEYAYFESKTTISNYIANNYNSASDDRGYFTEQEEH